MKVIFKDIGTKKEIFNTTDSFFEKIELNSAIVILEVIYRVMDKMYVLNENKEIKEVEVYLQKYETK